jgi:hypothetical protein
MKNRVVPNLIAGLILIIAAVPVFGQNGRLNISNLEPLAKKAAEVVDVNLDGQMLELANKFMDKDTDAGGKEILKGIQGIYVKSFEFKKPGEYSPADVEAIRSQLRTPEWTRIVGVENEAEGEKVEIYLTTAGADRKIQGMAIIAAEPTELTVVNIVGAIDIDKLSALEGKMGIPKLSEPKK